MPEELLKGNQAIADGGYPRWPGSLLSLPDYPSNRNPRTPFQATARTRTRFRPG